MKIKAIITDDGKMYKQVKSDSINGCGACPFEDEDCDSGDIICPSIDSKWQEVPEITDEVDMSKELTKYINEKNTQEKCVGFIEGFKEGANWYKQQLKQRLEE